MRVRIAPPAELSCEEPQSSTSPRLPSVRMCRVVQTIEQPVSPRRSPTAPGLQLVCNAPLALASKGSSKNNDLS